MTPNNFVPFQKSEPCLYILMRQDLASMNPGKAVAQGSHAANMFVHDVRINGNDYYQSLLEVWEKQTGNGFGTCIVLGVNEKQMRETIECVSDAGLTCGIVHDPTYPLRDGEVVHLIPLDTCAYVFGEKLDLQPFLSDLELMK